MNAPSALGDFLRLRRPSANPPARRDPKPRPAPPAPAAGAFSIRRTPEGFDVVSGNRAVAGVCWGTLEGVASFLSEEGWYELSDLLYLRAEGESGGGKVGYVFVHPSEESAFRGALLAAERELHRLGVREVYGHVGVQDVSDLEADARTGLWSRNGYDVVGEDRQHEPITHRLLPE